CTASPCCHLFFNSTPTTQLYPLSLHDALPILTHVRGLLEGLVVIDAEHRVAPDIVVEDQTARFGGKIACAAVAHRGEPLESVKRSEEHTSELQSLTNIVCRLLLEKKKKEHNVR